MNINALTAYLALSSGSYRGILRDMYAVYNLGLNPDLHTKLLANRFVGVTKELSGTPPLSFKSKGKPLTAWSITGNTVQNGTPTPENPIEVVGVGDRTGNLFDKNDCTVAGYIKDDGTISIKADNWFTTKNYIKCSGIITMNALNGLGSAAHIACYDEQQNLLGVCCISTSNEKQSTINLIDGTKYIKACSRDNNLDSLMLNEGSTALPYEPYGYKIPVVTSADGTEPITTPIYLPTPLYSGEVMRSDGSRDVKFGKLVLTGEEAISLHKPFADRTVSICIPSSKAKSNGIMYCTHLQNVSFKELYNSEKQGISTHLNSELNNLYCLISGFTNLTKYKDFFRNEYAAGTPVTVWYQLAEPTTETFTAPQIPTLNGTTVIDVDTAVKPESMTIKYRR